MALITVGQHESAEFLITVTKPGGSDDLVAADRLLFWVENGVVLSLDSDIVGEIDKTQGNANQALVRIDRSVLKAIWPRPYPYEAVLLDGSDYVVVDDGTFTVKEALATAAEDL